MSDGAIQARQAGTSTWVKRKDTKMSIRIAPFIPRMLFAAAALCLTSSVAMAQEAKHETKTVRGTIVISSDVKIGDQVLRAGEYKVTCDGDTITFAESTNRDRDSLTLKFPCKGKILSAPSTKTQLATAADAAGLPVVQNVLLKGSTVEHVFN
jgi:hypothetical protein